jgi:Thiol:disulfide interchange protein DsbD, N-terminal/AhpC/TSA family
VELQRNLAAFEREGIAVAAIGPDGAGLLRKFAVLHGITYPLLSDAGSRVIRQYGLLNRAYAEGHENYGIPHPGSYAIGADGRVFDKSFFASHRIRESIGGMLQEMFRVQQFDRGAAQAAQGPHLAARAYFAAPTLRRGQRAVLTVEVELPAGLHVYGRPLPEGYVPVTVEVDGGGVLQVERVAYPRPHAYQVDVTGADMPVYMGRLAVKVFGVGQNDDAPGMAQVTARLRYQACDDRLCFPPETVELRLSLEILPHDWQDLVE